YPSSVLAHARRQHRWVRGDWQILWWLLPFVPSRAGVQRNRLPIIARWKILDNLRRSLVPPATVALLVAGWTALPGSPLAWTAAALASLALPILVVGVEALAGPSRQQSWPVFARAVVDDLKTAAARSGLQLAFVANQAYERLHAIVVTLVRLGVTRHRLLEWETMAANAARGGPPRLRAVVAAVAFVRPRALPIALPVLLLWAGAPAIAFALSRPAPRRRAELTSGDREYLREVAVKTWRYFDTFMGAEDHWLPPDNIQMAPELRVAHRTSPTNIGLGLLSTLAAHDLGLIDTATLLHRIDATLTTVEGLEKVNGHLLNW